MEATLSFNVKDFQHTRIVKESYAKGKGVYSLKVRFSEWCLMHIIAISPVLRRELSSIFVRKTIERHISSKNVSCTWQVRLTVAIKCQTIYEFVFQLYNRYMCYDGNLSEFQEYIVQECKVKDIVVNLWSYCHAVFTLSTERDRPEHTVYTYIRRHSMLRLIWFHTYTNPAVFRRVDMYYLTHCSRETRKGVLGKQWRPRSDAAERGVWSGSPLFAKSLAIFL